MLRDKWLPEHTWKYFISCCVMAGRKISRKGLLRIRDGELEVNAKAEKWMEGIQVI